MHCKGIGVGKRGTEVEQILHYYIAVSVVNSWNNVLAFQCTTPQWGT